MFESSIEGTWGVFDLEGNKWVTNDPFDSTKSRQHLHEFHAKNAAASMNRLGRTSRYEARNMARHHEEHDTFDILSREIAQRQEKLEKLNEEIKALVLARDIISPKEVPF